MTDSLNDIIAALEDLHLGTFGEDFLLSWEKSDADIRGVALVAKALRELHRQGKSFRIFDTGLAVSIFRDKSTRTRFSFASAANALGLGVADLDEEKSQIAHGETVRETANMISFLTEAIGIRDDMFLGEGNAYMREVAAAVAEGFGRGVLHSRPTLVNLQCDVDHPTQSMADLLALEARFGSFEALKGRKIAMTWAYSPSYGKPLSVPQGIIGLLTRFGMHVALAHPEGYDLLPEVEGVARENAAASGGSFTKLASMEAAFEGADVVYPKSWAPFGVMQRRTALLKAGDKPGLADLERECLANNAMHRAWECDRAKMDLTKDKAALYMHCLPADISGVSCERGEVAKDVFEQHRIEAYGEAGGKPFVIAAMIFASKVKDPALALAKLAARSRNALSCD
jgi:knotted carbamoyltransferase YgeW